MDKRILVVVATEHGHAAFWLHELKHIEDAATNGSVIVLEPNGEAYRSLRSVWTTDRVVRALEEGLSVSDVSPPIKVQKVAWDGPRDGSPGGYWRDLVTGVRVDVP